MKRHVPSGKRHKDRTQDDAVFCVKTGALISSAPPLNVIPFPHTVTNRGAIEREIDKSQIVDNDDI